MRSAEARDRLGNLPSTILDNANLSNEQKKEAISILITFADVFGTEYKHLKKTDLVEFHLNEMVDHGVLVPHSYDRTTGNGWSFPCIYVTKKDGGKGLVTQFKKLNEVTVHDPWPIPPLKNTIEEIGSSTWLSNVDMLKRFNAIGVASDSINKLTLGTPIGAFFYKGLPFGVVNGPCAYARLMFLAVQPIMDRNKYTHPFLIHFFDDCSLFTNTFEDHLEKMKIVLQPIREVKLTLNSNKCHLFQHEIDLLGFNISKEGIKPLTEKVEKITEFPRPENQTGHIPGRKNVVADALSRFPPDDSLRDENGETVLENSYEHLLLESAAFYEKPLMDLYYKIKTGVIPEDPEKLEILLSKYKVFKNHLYKKLWKNTFVKIPHIDERQAILRNKHDCYGHFGINATWNCSYSQYWNPALHICNIPAVYLFQQYSLDFVGPFPVTNQGSKFILVAVENFSNWPIAEATSVQDSTVVANFLHENIFCQFGPFASTLTDNRSPFSNDIVDKFLAIIQSKHTFTTPYRPQCNGKNEKLNGSLSRAIKKLTHSDLANWGIHLHSVLYAYRTKVHEKTKLSPYQLLFRQNPLHTDSDPILKLRNNLGFERYSKLVDRNNLSEVIHGFKPVTTTAGFERLPKLLHPGDFLIKKRKKRASKLDTAFVPEILTVVTAYSNSTYKVADSQGRVLQRALNHNNIKQYFPRGRHE
ncbi:hypothetical protein [Parasitella parasitica]|uniref:Integrase catalytic domain-containing protein n=1 Tax=Parasitella parasitica TaxID=35722 RepID=A0A0B7NJ66_9FUNG|nr:hypothetical protein [Parasitella parasitica]